MKLLIVVFSIIVACSATLSADWAEDTVWVVKWTDFVTDVQFSKDESRILTSGEVVKVYDAKNGALLKLFEGTGIDKVHSGSYSEDDKLITALRYIPSENVNFVDVYDADSYELQRTFAIEPKGDLNDIKLSPDGKILLAIGGHSIHFIDFQTGKTIKTMTQFGDVSAKAQFVRCIFTKDSKYLIISFGGFIGGPIGKLWGYMMYINTQTYQMEYKFTGRVSALRISDDGNLLAYQPQDKKGVSVEIVNTHTHEILKQLMLGDASTSSLAFSPDGQYIAVSRAMYVRVYRVSDLAFMKEINQAPFYGLDFTADNNYLAVGLSLALIRLNLSGVGVTDVLGNDDLLYPNPLTNKLTVTFELSVPSLLSFKVFDMKGKFISNIKSALYPAGQLKEELILDKLSAGAYLLKIESPAYNKNFKFIVK